jgi:hypothetical protein
MKNKGYTGRSHEHSLNAKHITTVAESEKVYEYSQRYKYKILQKFREELNSMKVQLEKQGYKVEITQNKNKGITMTINDSEIQIYPNITVGNIGFIASDIKTPLPETDNIKELYLSLIMREAYKRNLMGYMKEYHNDQAIITIESKKPRGTEESIDDVKKMVNTIKSIEDLKKKI